MPTHRPIRPLFRPHRSWMFNVGTANGGASPNGCSFSKTGHWNLAIRPGRLLNYLDDAPPACWNLPTRIAAERGSAARRTAPRIHPHRPFCLRFRVPNLIRVPILFQLLCQSVDPLNGIPVWELGLRGPTQKWVFLQGHGGFCDAPTAPLPPPRRRLRPDAHTLLQAGSIGSSR